MSKSKYFDSTGCGVLFFFAGLIILWLFLALGTLTYTQGEDLKDNPVGKFNPNQGTIREGDVTLTYKLTEGRGCEVTVNLNVDLANETFGKPCSKKLLREYLRSLTNGEKDIVIEADARRLIEQHLSK